MNEKVLKAQEQLKAVYDDGFAEINGREYKFMKMQHMQRRKVFAYFTSVQTKVQNHDFSFLDHGTYQGVEKVMFDSILYDGSALSKLPNHWDEFPEDYVTLVMTALGVISYPFMKGGNTASQSQNKEIMSPTLSKPM